MSDTLQYEKSFGSSLASFQIWIQLFDHGESGSRLFILSFFYK